MDFNSEKYFNNGKSLCKYYYKHKCLKKSVRNVFGNLSRDNKLFIATLLWDKRYWLKLNQYITNKKIKVKLIIIRAKD